MEPFGDAPKTVPCQVYQSLHMANVILGQENALILWNAQQDTKLLGPCALTLMTV
jgi:hypothetical protein